MMSDDLVPKASADQTVKIRLAARGDAGPALTSNPDATFITHVGLKIFWGDDAMHHCRY
jgi:hypothetical protein